MSIPLFIKNLALFANIYNHHKNIFMSPRKNNFPKETDNKLYNLNEIYTFSLHMIHFENYKLILLFQQDIAVFENKVSHNWKHLFFFSKSKTLGLVTTKRVLYFSTLLFFSIFLFVMLYGSTW